MNESCPFLLDRVSEQCITELATSVIHQHRLIALHFQTTVHEASSLNLLIDELACADAIGSTNGKGTMDTIEKTGLKESCIRRAPHRSLRTKSVFGLCDQRSTVLGQIW